MDRLEASSSGSAAPMAAQYYRPSMSGPLLPLSVLVRVADMSSGGNQMIAMGWRFVNASPPRARHRVALLRIIGLLEKAHFAQLIQSTSKRAPLLRHLLRAPRNDTRVAPRWSVSPPLC